jgi:hypothetical protein
MTPTIDHDQLFRQLLETFFADFIELFAPALAQYLDLSQLTFLPQQYFTDILDGDRKAIDILVQVPVKPSEMDAQQSVHTILLHVENQSTSRSNFAQRVFFYFAELHREYRLPIYPIALFSFDEPQRAEPNQYKVSLPELDVLTFNFQSIQLNRLNWRDFLQYHNPVAAALMAKMSIEEEDRPKVKVECLRLLANLQLDPARNFLISGFVDTYLRLNQNEEQVFIAEIAKMGTVTEQEQIMELTTSWMERGLEQGLTQGLAQGLNQGLEQERRSSISSLMELRYGSIDEPLLAILPALMALTSPEYNRLLLQLSKQELIEHFRSAQN